MEQAGEEVMIKKMGVPGRQPTRKPGVARYNSIIAAAEYLILEAESLETISLDAVAKQAAVPRASLYYFFASIESLLDALYQRGVQKMIAELPQSPKGPDWRELMVLYIDSVRDFYLKNRVEMILALLPVSLVAVNKVSSDFGGALFTLLYQQDLVLKTRKTERACEICSELADLVWRKSLIEKGTITPTYHKEARRVVLAYLESVLAD